MYIVIPNLIGEITFALRMSKNYNLWWIWNGISCFRYTRVAWSYCWKVNEDCWISQSACLMIMTILLRMVPEHIMVKVKFLFRMTDSRIVK